MQLYNSYKTRYEELNTKFDEYLDEYQETIVLNDKKLKEALKDQVELQLVFEAMYSNTKRLQGFIEEEAENAFAEAIKSALSDNYRDVSITEAREIAKTDPMYRRYRRLNIDATGLTYDAKAALETVTTRRYVMNNMANAVIASVENTLL